MKHVLTRTGMLYLWRALLAGVVLAISIHPSIAREPAGGSAKGAQDAAIRKAEAAHHRLEFVANKGQWPGHVLCKADLPGGQAIATPDGMLSGLFDPASLRAFNEYLDNHGADPAGLAHRLQVPQVKGHGWRIRFAGANPFSEQRLDTIGRSFDYYNYLNLPGGGSATEVHSYRELYYRNVYKGVDVRYYSAPDGLGLENDIIVAPGTDPSRIAFHIDGVDEYHIAENGSLELATSVGPIAISAPVSYTVDAAGKQVPVSSRFRINADRSISFEIESYDRSQTLVIDPIVMRWSTWVSNNATVSSHNHGIDLDNNGFLYVSGFYGSTGLITVGAFQSTLNGTASDAYFGKYLEPATPGGAGTRLWQTYLGGTGSDNVYAISIGPDNVLYAVATTTSVMPTTFGTGFATPAYTNRSSASSMIACIKVNPLGTGALVRTLGATAATPSGALTPYSVGILPTPGTAFNIAVSGVATMATGFTANGDIPQPVTPAGTSFTPSASTTAAYAASLSSDFSTINWTRNIGVDNSATIAYAMAIDGGNNIYLGGGTTAASGISLNNTSGQAARVGTQDAFLIKLSGAGTTLQARYINSSGAATATSIRSMNIAFDNASVVTGGITTGIASANLAGTPYSTTLGGSNDFFVARFPLTLASTTWGTYLGGSGNEVNVMGLNTDLNNDVYILGYSASSNFPTAANPIQSALGGTQDATFTKLSANGQSLLYSTYIGGTADENDPIGNNGIRFKNCRTYLAITAASQDFPLTTGTLTSTKSSATTVYEPVIVSLANPPDFNTTTVTPATQTVTCGSQPASITAATPAYTIPTISRAGSLQSNGTPGAYPSGVPSASTGANYIWQRSVNYGTTWTNIAGATGLTLTGTQMGAVSQNSRFRLVVNGDACNRVASYIASVNTTSDVQAGPSAACSGGNVTFYANASGSGTLTYTWVFPPASLRTPLPTSASFTLTGVTATDAGYYTVTVSNGTCSTTRTLYFSAADCSFIPNSSTVPIAQNITTQPLNAASALPALAASDPSGYPIVSYEVNAPTGGALYYCTAGTPAACTGGTLTQITATTTLTPAQAATLYYVPTPGATGSQSFTYSAAGPNGISNTATVTVPLYNLPPLANSMTLAAVAVNSINNPIAPLQGADPESATITYNVTAPNVAQGTISYCSNGAAAPACTGGTLTPISGTVTGLTAAQAASIAFSPAANYNGLATFTYTTTDNASLSSQVATVTIPVTAGALSPSNTPPVTLSYTTEVMPNTAGPRPIPALSATDADGSLASFTITTPPPASQGTLYYCASANFPCTGTLTAVPTTGTTPLTTAQAATMQFSPAPTFTGNATFSFTATDNDNAVSNISTVTVPIQNPPPLALNIVSAPVTQNSTNGRISGPLATDNGTIATYTITIPTAAQGVLRYCSNGATPPACTGGTLTVLTAATPITPAQAATLTFTPAAGFDSTVVLNYTATDNNGALSNIATLSIPISGGQYPSARDFTAAAVNANVTVPQSLSTALLATVNAANAGGSITSYQITSTPVATQGVLRYCSNGAAAPACTGGTLTTVTAPVALTAAQAASLVFYPVSSYEGPATFTYTATDNRGNLSNTAHVNLNVVNTAPVAQNAVTPITTPGGAAVTAPLAAIDSDGTVVSYIINTLPPASQGALSYCATGTLPGCTAVALPAGTTLTPAQAATVRFTPAATVNTTDVSFTYSAVDNGGRVSNLGTIEIPVLPARPVQLVIAQNLAWAPANRAGAVPTLVAATQSGIGIRSFVVNAPSSGTLQYCTAGTPTACTGGTLTTIAATATLTPAQAATLYYTPVAGATGIPTFTYTAIANDDAVSNVATVRLPLYNLPPTANGYTTQAIATNSSASTALPPLVALDPEAAALSYSVTAPSAAQGTLKTCSNNTVPCTGTFTNLSGTTVLTAAQVAALAFTPAAGFSGNATFTYTVTDNAALTSNTATINIPVTPGGITPANIAPVTQHIVAEPMFQNAPATPLPALSVADPNNGISSVTITVAPPAAQGTLYYCNAGTYPCGVALTAVPVSGTTPLTAQQAATLQFQPNPTFTGNAVFSYIAADNYSPAATSNTSIVTIPVLNPAPLAANTMTANVLPGSSDTRIYGPAASDNGSIQTYTITTLPNGTTQGVLRYCTAGTPTACAGGSYTPVIAGTPITAAQAATMTFTPVAGFTGNVSVPYTATDNNGVVSNTATINIPVYSLNPPVAADFVTAAINTNSTTPLSLNTALTGTPNATTASAITRYTISSVPPASQGLLTYCPTGSSGCTTPVTEGLILTAAQKATLQFLPNGTFSGTAIIEYTASDALNQVSNLASVQIPVVNRIPEAASVTSATAVAGGAAVPVLLSGADLDGSLASFTINTIPPASQGTLTYCTSGTLPACTGTPLTAGQTITPAQALTVRFAAASGINTMIATFLYTVTDNSGAVSNLATASIPVSPTTPANTVIAQNITASPTNIATTLPALSAASQNGAAVTSYTVNAPATGTLQYCTAGTPAACAGGTLTTISTSAVLTPAQAATLYYTPAPGSIAAGQFTYTATSGDVTSAPAIVTVPVYNIAPVAKSMATGPARVNNATAEPIPALLAGDIDGTVVSFTVTPPSASEGVLSYCSNGAAAPACSGGTLNTLSTATVLTTAQAANLAFIPAASYSGNATFTFIVTDNNGNVSNTATVTVPVTPLAFRPANLAPVTQSYQAEPVVNTSPSAPIPGLAGADPDGSIASYTVVTVPATTVGTLSYCASLNVPCTGSLVTVSNGTALTPAQAAFLQFAPAAGFAGGNYSFTYTATDNLGLLSNVSTVNVPVINPAPLSQNIMSRAVIAGASEAPVASPVASDNGSVQSYNVTAPAVGQGVLRYCATGTCTSATLTTISGTASLTPAQAATLVFTPAAGFTGNASVTYTATDNNSLVGNSATILIPVLNVAPPAAADFTAAPINANTATPRILATALTGIPNPVSLAPITSYTIGTPPPVSMGSLQYCASGGTIPACTGGSQTTVTATGTVLTPAQAASLVFYPNSSFSGPVSFAYTATDNLGLVSNLASVTIPVQNLMPVAQNVLAGSTTPGGAAVTVPLSGVDPDGSVTTYVINTVPPGVEGALTYCASGTLPGCTPTVLTAGSTLTPAQAATVRFTPAAAVRNGLVSFYYSVIDNGAVRSDLAIAQIPVTGATPLPVTLGKFEARAENCAVVLRWEAANERGISHYQVERSPDGIAWTELRKVIANGTARGTQQYQTSDQAPLSGTNYYRLRIVEADASFSYTQTLSAANDCGAAAGIVISPNPFVDQIQVSGVPEGSAIRIWAADGKLVYNGTADAPVVTITTYDWAAASYMVRVEYNGRQLAAKQVLKSK